MRTTSTAEDDAMPAGRRRDKEARAAGAHLRKDTPPAWMSEWTPPTDRDPSGLLERAAVGRDRKLVEERNAEMAKDGPRFLRGAAGIMASDLRDTRQHTSGIELAVCGDAHVGNFGMYGSPERRRVFDITDFDEARPGPWEWDVCRLATSVVVTARHRDVDAKGQRAAVAATVEAYTDAIDVLGRGALIERWYALTKSNSLEPDDLAISTPGGADAVTRAQRLLNEADDKTQERTVKDLVEDGAFNDGDGAQTPLLDDAPEAESVRLAYGPYLDTLSDALRRLLRGYEPTAVARRPVGEGSLGLRNYLVLLCGLDDGDAMIVQVKEATPSLLGFGLDPYASVHEGERVVRLQRALQAVSDPLLGWTSIDGQAFYVRQFRDRKGTPDLKPGEDDGRSYMKDLTAFARLCGVTLARAHARAADDAGGQLVQISAYIGDKQRDRTAFRNAVVAFARTYADVTEDDQRHLRDQSGPWAPN